MGSWKREGMGIVVSAGRQEGGRASAHLAGAGNGLEQAGAGAYLHSAAASHPLLSALVSWLETGGNARCCQRWGRR
jgi:hypothetical protein